MITEDTEVQDYANYGSLSESTEIFQNISPLPKLRANISFKLFGLENSFSNSISNENLKMF